MGTYAIHGLVLGSDLDFSELFPANGTPADVELILGPTGSPPPEDASPEGWGSAAPDDTTISWRDFGTVRVRGGREIRLDPNPGLDERWLRGVVMGQVMSLVLQQRGRFPLHAASVVIGGGAVALAGPSGEGKSTLGAALVERGFHFLSDDVTALTENGAGLDAHLGIPRQRLQRDSLEALGLSADEFQPDLVDPEKCLRPVFDRTGPHRAPLKAVVVLERGPELSGLEPLSRRQAFTAVMEHMHRPELHTAALGSEELMRRCASVARAVPFFRLRRPRDLAWVAGAVRHIEEGLG